MRYTVGDTVERGIRLDYCRRAQEIVKARDGVAEEFDSVLRYNIKIIKLLNSAVRRGNGREAARRDALQPAGTTDDGPVQWYTVEKKR